MDRLAIDYESVMFGGFSKQIRKMWISTESVTSILCTSWHMSTGKNQISPEKH